MQPTIELPGSSSRDILGCEVVGLNAMDKLEACPDI